MQKDLTEKDFQRNKINSFVLKYLFPRYFTLETFELVDLLTKCNSQTIGTVTEGSLKEENLLINYQIIEEHDPVFQFLVGAPLNSGYFNVRHSTKDTIDLLVASELIFPDSMAYISKSYHVNTIDSNITVNSTLNIPFDNPHPKTDLERYGVLTKNNDKKFEVTFSPEEFIPTFVDI